MFNANFLNSIKNRVSMFDVISALGLDLNAENHGSYKMICCPVHGEDTPSLAVYADHFKCFGGGCDFKGDIFAFVSGYKKLPFDASVRFICDAFGIAVTSEEGCKNLNARVYYKVMSTLCDSFMSNANAVSLWGNRGFDCEFISEYKLGVCGAPLNHASLKNYLVSKFGNYPFEEWGIIDKLGNFPLKERMIIPILNSRGEPVSFIGRTYTGDKAKYKFMKTNDFYKKSEVLYLSNLALKDKEVILVEGHIDALSLHKAGYRCAMALGGCELSESCFERLKDKKIILALDNDKAGQEGTLKILLKYPTKEFYIARLEGYKDFNEMLVAEGNIKLNVISDVEFLALRVDPEDYDSCNAFCDLVTKRYMNAIATLGTLPGVNLIGFSKAIKILQERLDASFDVQKLMDYLYR